MEEKETDDWAFRKLGPEAGVPVVDGYDEVPQVGVNLFDVSNGDSETALFAAAGSKTVVVGKVEALYKKLAVNSDLETQSISVENPLFIQILANASQIAVYNQRNELTLYGTDGTKQWSSTIEGITQLEKHPNQASLAYVCNGNAFLLTDSATQKLGEAKRICFDIQGNAVLGTDSAIKLGSSSVQLPKDGSLVYLQSAGASILAVVSEDDEYTAHLYTDGSWTEIPDACPPFGDDTRFLSWYTGSVAKWVEEDPLVLVASASQSSDILLATSSQILSPSEDADRASMPFTEEETSPVGASVYTASSFAPPKGFAGVEESAPMPIWMVLTNEGSVTAWAVLSREALKSGAVLATRSSITGKLNPQAKLSAENTASELASEDALEELGGLSVSTKTEPVPEAEVPESQVPETKPEAKSETKASDAPASFSQQSSLFGAVPSSFGSSWGSSSAFGSSQPESAPKMQISFSTSNQPAASTPAFSFGGAAKGSPFGALSSKALSDSSSPFASLGSDKPSPFASSTEAKPKSIFNLDSSQKSENENPFGKIKAPETSIFDKPAGEKSVFGQSSTEQPSGKPEEPKSVFGKPAEVPKSVFGKPAEVPKSVFGKPAKEMKSPFGKPAEETESFFKPAETQSEQTQNPQQDKQPSLFGQLSASEQKQTGFNLGGLGEVLESESASKLTDSPLSKVEPETEAKQSVEPVPKLAVNDNPLPKAEPETVAEPVEPVEPVPKLAVDDNPLPKAEPETVAEPVESVPKLTVNDNPLPKAEPEAEADQSVEPVPKLTVNDNPLPLAAGSERAEANESIEPVTVPDLSEDSESEGEFDESADSFDESEFDESEDSLDVSEAESEAAVPDATGPAVPDTAEPAVPVAAEPAVPVAAKPAAPVAAEPAAPDAVDEPLENADAEFSDYEEVLDPNEITYAEFPPEDEELLEFVVPEPVAPLSDLDSAYAETNQLFQVLDYNLQVLENLTSRVKNQEEPSDTPDLLDFEKWTLESVPALSSVVASLAERAKNEEVSDEQLQSAGKLRQGLEESFVEINEVAESLIFMRRDLGAQAQQRRPLPFTAAKLQRHMRDQFEIVNTKLKQCEASILNLKAKQNPPRVADINVAMDVVENQASRLSSVIRSLGSNGRQSIVSSDISAYSASILGLSEMKEYDEVFVDQQRQRKFIEKVGASLRNRTI